MIFYSERATICFYVKAPNEIANRSSVEQMRCANEPGSLYLCGMNYKHNSEYNPRYNISSLCDISVNLLRATMLYDA